VELHFEKEEHKGDNVTIPGALVTVTEARVTPVLIFTKLIRADGDVPVIEAIPILIVLGGHLHFLLNENVTKLVATDPVTPVTVIGEFILGTTKHRLQQQSLPILYTLNKFLFLFSIRIWCILDRLKIQLTNELKQSH